MMPDSIAFFMPAAARCPATPWDSPAKPTLIEDTTLTDVPPGCVPSSGLTVAVFVRTPRFVR